MRHFPFQILTLLAAGWLCLGVGACSNAAPLGCEPLEPQPKNTSIHLEKIVAIGRAQDGRVILIDRSGQPSELRLFVSDDNVLVRRDVGGSGEGTAADGSQFVTVSAADIDPPMTVFAERAAGHPRMKLLQAPNAVGSKSPDFASAPGDEIEALDLAAVAGFSLRDLPGDVTVEYFARVGDDRLVVTTPKYDAPYDAARLFFGPPSSLFEHKIAAFRRTKGGSTTIVFMLDGKEASVVFSYDWVDDDSNAVIEHVSFAVGGVPRSIVRVTPPDDPELQTFHFQCTAD